MIIIYAISLLLILLYLIYPLWLMLVSSKQTEDEIETAEINSVSLILLSYNGKKYLREKIGFLLEELARFTNYELLIIDDNSTDGSQDLLESFRNKENIKIIFQDEHKGIPHAMNMGVELARYGHIIFCDQRQKLSDNIILQIVKPLRYRNIGAVSACISHLDKSKCCSWVRKHENFIKAKESKSGNLIGVYGPFYAIKKDCYSSIPDEIILDDLYLSIKIIQTKQIKILSDCRIIDDGFSVLYDYKRARRYVYGFWQIIKEKDFIKGLNTKQQTMLMWHKYLRLLIPVSLFVSFIATGIIGIWHIEYLIAFLIITAIGIASVIPHVKIKFRIANLICVNIFYFLAISDICVNEILLKRERRVN